MAPPAVIYLTETDGVVVVGCANAENVAIDVHRATDKVLSRVVAISKIINRYVGAVLVGDLA